MVRRNGNQVCHKLGRTFILETFTQEKDAILRADWLRRDDRSVDPNQPQPRFTNYLDRWPRGWTQAMEVK